MNAPSTDTERKRRCTCVSHGVPAYLVVIHMPPLAFHRARGKQQGEAPMYEVVFVLGEFKCVCFNCVLRVLCIYMCCACYIYMCVLTHTPTMLGASTCMFLLVCLRVLVCVLRGCVC